MHFMMLPSFFVFLAFLVGVAHGWARVIGWISRSNENILLLYFPSPIVISDALR